MKKFIQDQKGQMLVFVLIILLVLFIIVIAIVVNVRTDLRSTQQEREYEQNYSNAESELLNIIDAGVTSLAVGSTYTAYTGVDLCPLSKTEGCSGNWQCLIKSNYGGVAENAVIIKSCDTNQISNEEILKDKTLEVDLNTYTKSLNLTWSGTNTLNIILVYKEGDVYKNVRKVICMKNSDSNFPDCQNASVYDGKKLNLNAICSTCSFEFMRIRALKGDATGVSISGADLPSLRTIVRAQGVTVDTVSKSVSADISAPEVYTSIPTYKQLPALFDYVLFVADGPAGHN